MSAQRVAVFDIDGTLIRWQLFHAITEELAKMAEIDPASYQSVKAARFNWHRRANAESYNEYEEKLISAFDESLKGLSVKKFKMAAERVFDEYKEQVYTFTRDLIKRLKKDGYLIFALSGSPDIIVSKLAKFYGFDDYAATIFFEKDGYFTGQKDYVIYKKDELFRSLINKHKASQSGSMAVGDTELDIALLAAVEQPIAFNPTKRLFEHAKKHGWQIVIERKNVVYKLEQKNGKYQLG